ncbi:uncharacterized protein [Henckelia pumila]|uniref:uncharacterized protein n=1 Tax=Henckelia pumila TaxID=405737 RepID=UPI003C6E9450
MEAVFLEKRREKEFLNVENTSGLSLFNELCAALDSLGLEIDNIRGQGYDNGSNMRGRHQGVQKRLLDINPRAFYMPCGSHSLNLVICDMASSCVQEKSFFGACQCIYTVFSNSTKRWSILLDCLDNLTLKSLCTTRWESHIESVKAIKSQVGQIREALLKVADLTDDARLPRDARLLATHELMKQLKGLVSFFENYREVGFASAINSAKETASNIGVDPVFLERRQTSRKKQFDEIANTGREPQTAKNALGLIIFLLW